MNRIHRRTRAARPRRVVGAVAGATLLSLLLSAGLAAAEVSGHASGDAPGASPSTPAPEIARKQRKGPEPQDKPAEAAEFFLEKRLPASEREKPRGERQLPLERYAEARERARGFPRFSTQEARFIAPSEPEVTARAAQWTALGPGNVGGRTRTIAFDPNDANTMYAGGVAGGVWKTTDGGTTWTALGDIMSNMAVTAIVVDRTSSSRIYAGTGEGFFNGDAVRGAGIFVSEDAGVTWTQVATTNNTNFHYVMRLVQSPNDANVFYAGTRNGLWRTLDRGATAWTQQIVAPNARGCTDFEVRTDVTPDAAIASCGQFAPTSNETGIYHSTAANTGTPAWSRRVGPAAANLALTSMGRASLAIAPSAQGTMYALVSCSSAVAADCGSGAYNNGVLGVYRSTDGGASWAAQFTNTFATGNGIPFGNLLLSNPIIGQCGLCQSACGTGATNQFFNQGWYDNEIAVDPADATIVWAGGVDLMRSDDSGANWRLASYWWFPDNRAEYAHADQHLIRFHPGYNGTTNRTMFVGDDGGVYRTDNARAAASGPETTSQATNPVCGSQNLPAIAWSNLNNGYGVTQFYHGTVYPNGQTYLGGTQDNGTNRGNDGSGANAWTEIFGGDGGYVATDPTTSGGSRVLYLETTGISIRKSVNDGASFSCATNGIVSCTTGAANDCGLFINPFTINPDTPSTLWTSGRALWRTTDAAASWTQASNQLTASCSGERYSSHAVAPGDSNLLLAGTSAGRICRLTNATTSTSATVPACVTPSGASYVSSVAFDPNNTGNADTRIAYATFSTFGVPHVWKSTNGGQTWASIDGTGANALPDVPAHSVVVHPAEANTLWVGTDIGIFVTLDGGVNWNRENSGFANVITEHLQLNDSGATGRELFAFTHGRGAFKAAVQQDQAIAINDAFSVGGNSGANTFAVLANDVAQQGTGTLNVVSATDPPHGTTSVGGGGANVVYTPDAGYCSGPDFFHYTINGSDSALVSVSVGTCPADVPPTAVADAATVLEDAVATAVNVLANDTDPDGGPKSIQSVTQPAGGTVVITGGGTGLTYAPNPNSCNNGSPLDTFTYALNGGSSTTVSMTVTCVNDAPAFSKGADQTVLEDAGAQSVSGWATAISAGPANEAGQTVSFAITNNTNAALFAAGPAVAANGTLTFTPAANANGSATITLRIADNGGTANGGVDQSATQAFVVSVTAVNDVPSFTRGADQGVLEDAGAQSVTNWASAISAGPNEGGQTVSFAITNNTNAGLFSTAPAVAANGTLSYTPAANASGSATITLRIADNGGTANGGVDQSATQSFVINVTAVNDAPVLNDRSATIGQGVAAGTLLATLVATDIDSAVLTYAITGGNTGGAFAVDPATGAITVATPSAVTTANSPIVLAVSVSDGALGDTAAISVTILPDGIFSDGFE